MAAFVTILSASSWIFSKKLNIKNNIVTSNPLMKRKLGLIDASSSQRCCDITVLFVSELSSYSGTSQWSHPALSHQRGYQKIQLQTHSMYIHTHTLWPGCIHVLFIGWEHFLTDTQRSCHLFTNRFKFTQHFCPTVNPEALNQLLSTVKSKTNFVKFFVYKKKKAN